MMSEETIWIVVVSLCAVALYGALVRGVAILVLPLRQRLVETAARLVGSDRISDDDKEDIKFELERNFSSFDAWLTALYVVPALIKLAFGRLAGRKPTVSNKFEDEELREFWSVAVITSLSNSPIALILFAMQMALVTVFAHYRTMVRQLLMMVDSTHHRVHPRKLVA